MANRWDYDAGSILKYLSRFRLKNGIADLNKGRHFAEMRAEFDPPAPERAPVIRMRDYIEQNGFHEVPTLKHALDLLWDCVYIFNGPKLYTPHLIRKIDELIDINSIVERI